GSFEGPKMSKASASTTTTSPKPSLISRPPLPAADATGAGVYSRRPSPRQSAEGAPRPTSSQPAEQHRHQDRSGDAVQRQADARERACQLVDLERARGAEPMRRHAGRQAAAAPVADAERAQERGHDHRADDAGSDDERRRQGQPEQGRGAEIDPDPLDAAHYRSPLRPRATSWKTSAVTATVSAVLTRRATATGSSSARSRAVCRMSPTPAGTKSSDRYRTSP